jgi:hypothetical protein
MAEGTSASSVVVFSGVNSPRSSKASLMFILAPQRASLSRTGAQLQPGNGPGTC